MRKSELLAPAGSMQALKAAVQNGADAVFLGGRKFGARASAVNFSIDEIKEAVSYAHLYGVKIYVTVNTLIKDNEMEDALAYVKELYDAQVDALIIQDLGLMDRIMHEIPEFEMHASTQMHVHNLEGLRFLERLGFKRSVVARESSLDLIREMCKENIDIEVFVQGAYCVSYSGQCLMSANIGGRSGNRGECAQTCRLPYTLLKEKNGSYEELQTKGEYLLSLKDLNALDQVKDMMEAGVASFKIEGRMKRPEYVALMTRMYRLAIDAAWNHQPFKASETMIEEMQKIFNRGFTSGYLTHEMGRRMMSTVRPNHQGIEIGVVTGVNKQRMQIKLTKRLNQHDGIRILNKKEDTGFIVNYIYKNGKLVNHGENEIIELERCKYVNVNDKVVKTSDALQLEALSKTIDENRRKVMITGKVIAHLDQPFILQFKDEEGRMIEACSQNNCEQALKVALSEDRIYQQISKLGNTPFVLKEIEMDVQDGISFPISSLNELRRQACEMLISKRQEPIHPDILSKQYPVSAMKPSHDLTVTIINYDQYEIVKNYPVKIEVIGRSLYERIKEENPEVIYQYPRVYHDRYDQSGVIHDVGGLDQSNYASPFMNTRNAYTANFFARHKMEKIALSYETTSLDACELAQNYEELTGNKGNFEKVVYGRIENMVNETCPVNAQITDNDKKKCQLCKKNRYALRSIKGEIFPLLGDEDCRMHVYHNEIHDEIDFMDEYRKAGITNFKIHLTFENKDEIVNILKRFVR